MLERVSFVTLFAAASLVGCSTGDERPGSALEQVVVPLPATTQALSPATVSVPVSGLTASAHASVAAPGTTPVPALTGSTSGAMTGSTTPAPVSTAPVVDCLDTVPDDRETCQTWKDWGECESGWLKDPGFCNATCGRCPTTTPSGSTPNPMGSTPDPSGTSTPPANSGGMGDDNPYMPITRGGEGFATRYWDCSKQSCGWSGNAGGNAVKSCNKEGGSLGVTEERNGFDGGNAFTCFSFAPWAHSTEVAYGFAATHVSNTCGKCYQLQFTGAGNSSPNDPGSNALQGKTMVVMAANIGGDVGGNQLDILIPGGGVGAVNACVNQGLPPMGAQYGGFLTECSGDLNAKKECVRQKCNTAFADAKYADLKKGCAWFVDWFQAADNPRYLSKEIPCPQELNSAAR